MVIVSNSLTKEICKILQLSYEERKDQGFTIEELAKVKIVSISKMDIKYLEYFTNLEFLTINGFPSINDKDLEEIKLLPIHITKLEIAEQSGLFNIDLKGFEYLDSLTIIHNENLVKIDNIGNIKEFVMYDNKEYYDIDLLWEIMKKDIKCTYDFTYYYAIYRKCKLETGSIELLDKNKWIECYGLRTYFIHECNKEERKNLTDYFNENCSKYLFSLDSDYIKLGVLYDWMISHIKFSNVEELSIYSDLSTYKVFDSKKGFRLSYAKAFQMLLGYVGIKSVVVYSVGAMNSIGMYNGEQVYSLLGSSDYALLRVNLDNKDYYLDISWDSMMAGLPYYDELRLFLVSKEELKLRHHLVGEANVVQSYSYHGDDSDDLLMFVKDRIRNVDLLFKDLRRVDPDIKGTEISISLYNGEIKNLENRLDLLNSNSKEYRDTLVEIDDLKDILEEEQSKLFRFHQQFNNIVKNYSYEIKSHYWVEGLDLNDKYLLLSKYLVGILRQVVES